MNIFLQSVHDTRTFLVMQEVITCAHDHLNDPPHDIHHYNPYILPHERQHARCWDFIMTHGAMTTYDKYSLPDRVLDTHIHDTLHTANKMAHYRYSYLDMIAYKRHGALPESFELLDDMLLHGNTPRIADNPAHHHNLEAIQQVLTPREQKFLSDYAGTLRNQKELEDIRPVICKYIHPSASTDLLDKALHIDGRYGLKAFKGHGAESKPCPPVTEFNVQDPYQRHTLQKLIDFSSDQSAFEKQCRIAEGGRVLAHFSAQIFKSQP